MQCEWLTYEPHYGLRGSASPVLTATGLVNGKGQFSTLYRIDTPQPITKNLSQVTVDPYSCAKFGAHPSTGSFWVNERNITKILIYLFVCLFIYLYPFWKLTDRSDPSAYFRAWRLKRRGLAQGCAFLGFVDMAPHLGVTCPQTSDFGAWIDIFKPNSRNWKTCILPKLLHRF